MMEPSQGKFQDGALHEAVLSGDITIVRTLLDAGINIDEKNEEGISATDLATIHNKSDILRLLIDTKELIQLVSTATRSKKPKVVGRSKSLVDQGASVNARDSALKTALLYATENDNFSVVEVLIKSNANYKIKTSDDRTSLHVASERNNFAIAKTLLSNYALQYSHKELMEFLDARDVNGNTALHLASITGNTSTIILLLRYGAVFDAPNNSGLAPVDLVRSYVNFFERISKTFDRVLDSELNWYVRDNVRVYNWVRMARRRDGYTVFCWAVENNKANLIEDLLYDKDANLSNMTTSSGLTALHIASRNGNVELVNRLLDYEDSSDFLDARTFELEDSALHLSANKAIALALLKHGATYCIKNRKGLSALEQNADAEVKTLLGYVDQAFKEKRLSTEPSIPIEILNAKDATGSTLNDIIQGSTI